MTQMVAQKSQSQAWIRSQLPDYPYDLFVEEIEHDRYACLIEGCHREFGSYDDYLSHFLYNNSHLNFMKRNLMTYEPRSGLGEEVVWDPIEKEQIEWNIRNNPDYAALKYNRDVTPLLEEKIEFAIKNNRNIIAEVLGIPGAGKSYATIALATIVSGHWADKLNKDTTVDLDFELAGILELIGKYYKGDSLIQDEDPRGFGAGSATNAEAFENLAKTLRKRCISLFVVSPTDTRVENVNFVIEFFAYYPKERVTKGVLYTRKKIALGYVYIEILDYEDYAEYEKKKDAFIDKMQLSGGFGIQNYNDDRIKRDFDDLLKYVQQKDPGMTKTRVLGCASVKVRGDRLYQQMIADDVYDYLTHNKQRPNEDKKEPVKVSKQGTDYEWHHTRTETDIGILQDLFHFAQAMDFSPFVGENVTEEELLRGMEAWRLRYIDELSYSDASKELNRLFTRPMDTKMYFRSPDGKVKKFIQGPMGTAGELVIQKWFYPNYDHVGGNNNPDLINPALEHVVEVKWKEKEQQKSVESLIKNDTYLRALIAKRISITVVIVDYSIGDVSVEFHDIVYTDGRTLNRIEDRTEGGIDVPRLYPAATTTRKTTAEGTGSGGTSKGRRANRKRRA